MTMSEHELTEQITTILRLFQHHNLHLHTKKDPREKCTTTTMQQCMTNIMQSTNLTKANYSPIGPATVWHNRSEVSDSLESAIRHAASTASICEYMQTKYNWDSMTIDDIDWMVHADALQSFPPSQQITLTKFIHEWLPVNGHPSLRLTTPTQSCPSC
jgi:hypothetical protein